MTCKIFWQTMRTQPKPLWDSGCVFMLVIFSQAEAAAWLLFRQASA